MPNIHEDDQAVKAAAVESPIYSESDPIIFDQDNLITSLAASVANLEPGQYAYQVGEGVLTPISPENIEDYMQDEEAQPATRIAVSDFTLEPNRNTRLTPLNYGENAHLIAPFLYIRTSGQEFLKAQFSTGPSSHHKLEAAITPNIEHESLDSTATVHMPIITPWAALPLSYTGDQNSVGFGGIRGLTLEQI